MNSWCAVSHFQEWHLWKVFKTSRCLQGMFFWSACATWNNCVWPFAPLAYRSLLKTSVANFFPNFNSEFLHWSLCSNFLPMAKLQTAAYMRSQKHKFHSFQKQMRSCRSAQCPIPLRSLLAFTGQAYVCCYMLAHSRTSTGAFSCHLIYMYVSQMAQRIGCM